METGFGKNKGPSGHGFKSHHSGMETTSGSGLPVLKLTLNRTIVGWKHTHRPPVECPPGDFKSHHSGMETKDTALLAATLPALNRTIVGWKHGWGTKTWGDLFTLNRTIVGWKRF